MNKLVDASSTMEIGKYSPTHEEMSIYIEFLLFIFCDAPFLLRYAFGVLEKFVRFSDVCIECLDEYEDLFALKVHTLNFEGALSATNLTLKLLQKGIAFEKIVDTNANLYPYSARLLEAVERLPQAIVDKFKDTDAFKKMVSGIEQAAVRKVRETENHRRTGVLSTVRTRQDLELLRRLEIKRQLELEALEIRIKQRRGDKSAEVEKRFLEVQDKMLAYGGSSSSPIEAVNIILNAAKELAAVSSEKLRHLSLDGRVNNQATGVMNQIDSLNSELQVLRLNVAFMGPSRTGKTSLIWGLVGLPGLTDPYLEDASRDTSFKRVMEGANQFSRMQIAQRAGTSVCPVEYIHNPSAREPFIRPNKIMFKLLSSWVQKAKTKKLECPQSVWKSIDTLLASNGVFGDRNVVQVLQHVQDFLIAAVETQILSEIDVRAFANFGRQEFAGTDEEASSGWGSGPRLQIELKFAVFSEMDAFGEVTLLDVPAMDNDWMCHEDILELNRRLVACSEFSVFVLDAIRTSSIGMWDSRTGGPLSPECLDVFARTIASMPNGFTAETAAVVLSQADRLDKFNCQIHIDSHIEKMAKYITATQSSTTIATSALNSIKHLIEAELGRPSSKKNICMDKYVKGGPMRAIDNLNQLTPNEKKKLAAERLKAVREKMNAYAARNESSDSQTDDKDDDALTDDQLLAIVEAAPDLHDSIASVYGSQFLQLTAKTWWDSEDVLKRQGKKVDVFDLERDVVNQVLAWILTKASAIPGTNVDQEGLPLGGMTVAEDSKSSGGRRKTITPVRASTAKGRQAKSEKDSRASTVRGRAVSIKWRESMAEQLEKEVQLDKKAKERHRYTSANIFKGNEGIRKSVAPDSEDEEEDDKQNNKDNNKNFERRKSKVGFGANTEYDIDEEGSDAEFNIEDMHNDDDDDTKSRASRKSKTGVELKAIIDSVVSGTRGNQPLVSFVSGLFATLSIYGLYAVRNKQFASTTVVIQSDSKKGSKKLRSSAFGSNIINYPWIGKLMQACEGITFMRKSSIGVSPARMVTAVKEVGSVSRVLKGLLGCTLRSKCDELMGSKVEGSLALLQESMGLLENTLLDLTTGGSAQLLTEWDASAFQSQLIDKLSNMFKRMRMFNNESVNHIPSAEKLRENIAAVMKQSGRLADDTVVFRGSQSSDVVTFFVEAISAIVSKQWLPVWTEAESERIRWLKSVSKDLDTTLDHGLVSVSADVSLRQRVLQTILPAVEAVDKIQVPIGGTTLSKIKENVKNVVSEVRTVNENSSGFNLFSSGPKTFFITYEDISKMFVSVRSDFLKECDGADKRMKTAGDEWNLCAKEAIDKVSRASERVKKSGAVMKKGWEQVQNHDGYVIEVVGPKGVRIHLAFARTILKGIEKIMEIDPASLLAGLHSGHAGETVVFANHIANQLKKYALDASKSP
eukprot:GDKJ01056280.1.p1 GENE.GDKJ01056280.1~~GDKJ01056280.1.p1  ORF type:complete len:1462 (-),score=346.67 GDKJ01056280.1:159-4430(-)